MLYLQDSNAAGVSAELMLTPRAAVAMVDAIHSRSTADVYGNQ